MAKNGKKPGNSGKGDVVDYRHKKTKRLNIPPAGLAARGEIVKEKQVKYAYNPHLTPTLRFDAEGKTDKIAELVEASGKRKLEPKELKLLEEALRNHEPWLEWAGKREQQWCVADPVALHIHERVSTQAILRVAQRLDIERELFADPEQDYKDAVQFYKYPMDWANRMILGDSLSVMASLARREALAGKVQMIYMDPPYGISYRSNFQAEVGQREVKDRDQDLTREPEMVKAYRDTWTLGIHSYLSYLRDRLLLCKELLADAGSIFLQISDENLHRVRCLTDEVFGASNFIALLTFTKKGSQTGEFIAPINEYIVWYARDRARALGRFRQIYRDRSEHDLDSFPYCQLSSGDVVSSSVALRDGVPQQPRLFSSNALFSQKPGPNDLVEMRGRLYPSGGSSWKIATIRVPTLERSGRALFSKNRVRFKRFEEDFPAVALTNVWSDLAGAPDKVYIVQTNDKAIERCMLMTTDPGDLVLDPTGGSGTTAFVAEAWGRRWINIDVSRVALAVARQRLLTARHDYHKLRPTSAEDVHRNPDGPWLTDPSGQIQGSCTFECKTVPHVELRDIARNQALDSILDKWEPILTEKLAVLDKALKLVTKEARQKLRQKLEDKRRREGKKAITDADVRRWILPPDNKADRNYATVSNDLAGWYEWEVPFDTDPDWPKPLQDTLSDYRKAWRQKMDEVNACIAARANMEELVDQPFPEKGKVRVSGPFTMESVIPAEESIDNEESPIGGGPDDMETFEGGEDSVRTEAQNAEAYLDRMIILLRGDGVRFPDNKVMKFKTLEAITEGSTLHAQGTWGKNGEERRVAVLFGPQYGPLTKWIVEDSIGLAVRRGFDDLVFAAFSFDDSSQAAIQADQDPKLRIHMAHVRPDANKGIGDLLKTTVSSQLFTVSGSPRTELTGPDKDGMYVAKMEGVDIYDPVENVVRSTGAEKVAAWFLDSDYDARCFCICQAFFPDKGAWEKLGKALGGTLNPDALAKLSGTTSLPFPPGKHKRIAVKVIDPRGNEVMRVHKIGDEYAQ